MLDNEELTAVFLFVVTERPEGWYLDPENPRAHRYWDGERWEPVEPQQDPA